MKQQEADTLKGIIDLMTGSPVFDCMKDQSTVIKAKNEQIKFLKSEIEIAGKGLIEMSDTIHELQDTKDRHECLIIKLKGEIDKLKPEIEKSCDNIRYAEYSLKKDGPGDAKILKDGHTMFPGDIVNDLNRKSHLEKEVAVKQNKLIN